MGNGQMYIDKGALDPKVPDAEHRLNARLLAREGRMRRNTEEQLVDYYVKQDKMPLNSAILKAKGELARTSREPALEERIAELQRTNPREAQRVFDIAQTLAKSRATSINMPKTIPGELIRSVQSVRRAATNLSAAISLFDPSFVGMIGRLKGLSTAWSDLPFIPAFKEREKFVGKIVEVTAQIKKELIGAAQTLPELESLLKFLPDPTEVASVAAFTSRMESFLEGLYSELYLLPDTLTQNGMMPINLSRERAAVQEALAVLKVANTGNVLTPEQYQYLKNKGLSDEQMINDGYLPPRK